MKALFRVDASRQIGIGHLTRCLALAEALRKRQCESIFLTRDPDKIALPLIREDGFSSVKLMRSDIDLESDAGILKATALKYNADFVVADSYLFDNDYYRNVKDSGLGLLVIDDLAKGYITADIVLNQNVYAEELDYPAKTDARLLLGPSYALVRDDFRAKKDRCRPARQLRKILITLGGGTNKDSLTIEVIKTVSSIKYHKFALRVITKVERSSREVIKKILEDRDVSYCMEDFSNSIFKDMLWADLVICGGGTTTYELCSLGVPFMTVVLAENQRLNAESLERRGASINLGYHTALVPSKIRSRLMDLADEYEKRKAMAKKGMSLVDGLGSDRVREEILR